MGSPCRRSHSLPLLVLGALVLLAPGSALAAPSSAGPSRGSLVAIGGGHVGPEIHERAQALAGGADASIVVLPTAMPDSQLAREGLFDDMIAWMAGNGWSQASVLHTRDREEADRKAFVAPLRKAKAVWISGGRQWRLVDAYLGTRVVDEIRALLDRGGVVIGTSAGATIQGSFLARGDSKTNTVMMGDHQVGFGFLPNTAIDQHLLARNRQFDLFEILRAHPQLLGVGIDEGAALVVQGPIAEVVGSSAVAIYDGTFWSPDETSLRALKPGEERFYLLHPGQKYHLAHRRPIRPFGPELALAFESGADAALHRLRELRARGDEFEEDEPGLNGFGYMLLGAGRVSEALEVLERNTLLFPDSANAWDSLGEVQAAAGREDLALTSYRRSLALDTTNDNARRRIQALERSSLADH